MNIPSLSTLVPRLERFFPPAQPTVAAAIDEERIVVARVGRGRGGPELLGFFAAGLPQDALQASPVHVNIANAAALRPLLAAARDAVLPGGGPIALALPDSIVRVAVIAAAEFPRGREERREMIAWRLKKILPYRIDDAQVDSQAFSAPDGKHVVVAAAVKRRVVAEYEALFASAGLDVGAVTSSTLALTDLLPARLAGDALLVHVGVAWYSMLVSDGIRPLLVRSKALPDGERTGPARDAAILAEIAPTIEYHSGRLGRPGLRHVFVAAGVPGCEALIEALAEALPLRPEVVAAPALDAAPVEIAGALAPAFALAARGATLSSEPGRAAEAA